MTDGGSGPRIRTPDQRLRVFVSSTLKELEPERRAARAAIERLKLAPVMFELGARPHPPRQLYRAYLEQSDVFVALYWQEYGWVAPGEEISGLEDEYRLAPREMPKLIYLKQPAEREARLADLVARVRDDDTASYTPFSTVEELAELVATDLATLLAERFDASHAASEPTSEPTSESTSEPAPVGRLPAPYSDAVGRERELATLLDWIGRDAQRLVTLVGPGGIGKSRLAIEVARSVGAPFDRVTFVPLAQVRDPADVLPTVARALGLRDTDERPLSEQLGVARAGRHDLVVLDNFEQVLDAAPDVAALLTDLPDASFLVTSRARLRIRGEQVFDVDPLGLPPDPMLDDVDAILEAPAVQLFLDRAQAADARFEVTAENAGDVARICRALEGVPLAIELASARIRALTPAAMLARLDRMLPLLVTSARDVPERQRTIRATVEWSVELLGPEAEALFARLGVFAGDFSLDAVESVTDGEPWASDLLGTLLELVDGSLLRQHDEAGTSLFTMLVPVREVAAARFELDPDAAAVRRAHADHYVRLAAAIEPRLRGATQAAALERLEAEQDDLRAGYRHLIAIGDVEPVADAVWRLLFYWWIRNMLPEAKAWMTAILESDVPLSGRTRAIAMTFSSWVSLWQADGELRAEPMEESVALFREDGDELSEGLSLAILSLVYLSILPPDLERAEARVRSALELEAIRRDGPYDALFRASLGRIRLMRGDAADAARILEAAWDDAARIGDPFIESIAVNQFGWAHLVLGDPRPEAFARSLELAYGLNSEDGGAYGLEGLAAASAALGDFDRAGVMLGIADAMRARTGLSDQRSIVTYQQIIAQVLEGDHSDAFETGRARGRRMPRRAAIALALGQEPTA